MGTITKEKIPKPGETWGESEKLIKATLKMAQRTGLEPATPGVTGRYSNQLNYHCTVADDDDPNLSNWWVVTDSNRRHSACKADALPTELTTLIGNL